MFSLLLKSLLNAVDDGSGQPLTEAVGPLLLLLLLAEALGA